MSKFGCIDCKDPHNYFSLETSKCSKCPEGSTYNPIIRNCQKGGKQYLSNLDNKNYVVEPGKTLNEHR